MPGFGNFKAKSRDESVPKAWRTRNGTEVEADYVPEENDDAGNNSTGYVLFCTPALHTVTVPR